MAYQSIDPTTGLLLQSHEHLSEPALDAALAAAAAGFRHWRRTAFAERAAVLERAAGLLRERVDALARLATMEMGKRHAEARGWPGRS